MIALARHAMATRFEIVLHGQNEVSLRAAAEEALAEIERLDAQLSLYQPTSEISYINARAVREPVKVEPRLFRLLQLAKQLHAETGGAFDITIAPLMRCWSFMGSSGALPSAEQIAAARAQVGMQWVELNEEEFTVRFLRPGMMLDLGAIGKGYAVETAAEVLRDAGVTSALLHGGTSTVCAIGVPPGEPAWNVAIHPPVLPQDPATAKPEARPPAAHLAVVPLCDEAMSVSAVHGKAFSCEGKVYGHVIDPRTGAPTEGAWLAAVVVRSATESDALSTALLTLGKQWHERIAALRSGMRTLLVAPAEGDPPWSVEAKGIALAANSKVTSPDNTRSAAEAA